MINVSWQDVQVYIAWLSRRMGKVCRLPSEAEWEYAARAGTTIDYARSASNGRWAAEQTAPVGEFPANAWGVQDMHVNVWEWVEDCWHTRYEGAPDNGRAWRDEGDGNCSIRVLRGGSWDDDRDNARPVDRVRSDPYSRATLFGFRVVCVAHP